jgi:hypothetical protein
MDKKTLKKLQKQHALILSVLTALCHRGISGFKQRTA